MKSQSQMILLGILGIIVSITIITTLLYSDLRSKENLTVKLLKLDQTNASESNQRISENNINEEKFLQEIDRLFNDEKKIEIAKKEETNSKKVNSNVIKLQREAGRTTTVKDYLFLRDYQAIITDIQENTEKLNQVRSNNVASISALRIDTKIIPRIELRRKLGLMSRYNAALSTKIARFVAYVNSYSNEAEKYNNAVACINEAKVYRENGIGFLNGIMSQIGLFEVIQPSQSQELYNRLFVQLTSAKKEFDLSRNKILQCEKDFGRKANK